MGVSTRHVVMVGVEVDELPFDENDFEAYDEWMEKYGYRDAEYGDLVHFIDGMSGEYSVFGILLEMSLDGRWEPAYLSFAPREITDEDWFEVREAARSLLGIEDADPKLYVFTHFS